MKRIELGKTTIECAESTLDVNVRYILDGVFIVLDIALMRDHLTKNNILTAIQILKKYKENEAILLMSAYNALEESHLKGLIVGNEYRVESTKLVNSCLGWANRLG